MLSIEPVSPSTFVTPLGKPGLSAQEPCFAQRSKRAPCGSQTNQICAQIQCDHTAVVHSRQHNITYTHPYSTVLTSRGRSVIDRSSRAVYSNILDSEGTGLSHGVICIPGDLRISCARYASRFPRRQSAVKQYNVARSTACPSGQQYLLVEYYACRRRHMGHREGYLPPPESCRAELRNYAIQR